MEKIQKLKNIFIILTIIIMIPVIIATLMWLLVNIGSESFLLKLIFMPIKLTFILPVIKWGIFIVLVIWALYGIINAFNKKQKSSEIEKI